MPADVPYSLLPVPSVSTWHGHGNPFCGSSYFRFRALFDGSCNDLDLRVRLVSDSSTPMRSRELAPTNPTASVFLMTRLASSGVLMGPPWQRKKMSFRTRLAASMISCVRFNVKSHGTTAFLTPILPPTVVPT